VGLRIALLSLAACDAVFGLHQTETKLVDAPPPLDAFVVLTPPDGASACSGTPIDFTTWTFDAVATPSSLGVLGMTLYSVPGGQRVLFTAQAPVGSGAFFSVYDWDFVGTPAEITNLRAPPSTTLSALGGSPDGNALWLVEGGTERYATRSSGWTQQLASLGLSDPAPDPGAIGFHDGTARMVVASNAGATPQLVEVSSPDGLSWTPIAGGIPASGSGFFAFHNPALTPDACTLVFGGTTTGEVFNLYVAYRDSSDAFGAPVQIVTGAISSAYAPVLSADLANLWFISFSTSPSTLYHGHP
jgi:hypothetical protein